MNTEDNNANLDLIFESVARGSGPIKGDICIVDLGDKVETDDWDYVLRGRRPCIVLKVIGLRVEILPLTKNPIYDTGFSVQIPNSAYKSYPRYDNIMPVNRAKLSVMAPFNGANIIANYGIDVFNSIIDRIADYFKSGDRVFIEKREDVHNITPSEPEHIAKPLPIAHVPENKKPAVKEKLESKPVGYMEQRHVDNAPIYVRKIIDKYGNSFVLNCIQSMDSVTSADMFGVSVSTNGKIRKYFNDIGITPKGYTDRRERLTKKEHDKITELLGKGRSAKSIADELNVSINTIYYIIHK